MYAFERLNAGGDDWSSNIDTLQTQTIFQTPAWLNFLSETQNGEPIVAVLREGRTKIGYFTGMIVRKAGFRILGSPFPGWTTDYMGLTLSSCADKRKAVKALIDFTFHELRCVHLEVFDRNLTSSDLLGLNVQCRMCPGYEIDLSRNENDLFARMTSACRRCIRKAQKEGVVVEVAHGLDFADEYYAQLQEVFAKQLLVPTYDVGRVRHLIAHMHPTGQLLLLRARDEKGRSIATGIFPHMNGILYFWGGASWREHQHLRPNEAIQWAAITIGKKKGLHTYDMGGGGDYKKKYGGCEIAVPWFRKSKYSWIRYMREMAGQSHKVKQRVLGGLRLLGQNRERNNRLDSEGFVSEHSAAD